MTRIEASAFAGMTDVGRQRSENQDRWFADPAHGLYIVSDGIGGHRGGETASRIVTEKLPPILKRMLDELDDFNSTESIELLGRSIADLSERMRVEAADFAGLAGLGATVVVLIVRRPVALALHLGDSRAYRLHDGRLASLTTDHSLAQELRDNGIEDVSRAANHLTRYFGMPGRANVASRLVSIERGDRLLLCSDGLTSMLDEEAIERVLTRSGSPNTACERLIEAANAAGGKDNITAVVIDI